jgi:hypothetical protein
MNHAPRIGEGVLVPWGLSEVPGEVIDTRHATFDVEMRRELPPWRPLRVREGRQAVETLGRSAVEKYAFRFRLPRAVVGGSTGVFELRD